MVEGSSGVTRSEMKGFTNIFAADWVWEHFRLTGTLYAQDLPLVHLRDGRWCSIVNVSICIHSEMGDSPRNSNVEKALRAARSA